MAEPTKPPRRICIIPTEILIPLGEQKATFSSQRVTLRIDDEGAGPFLLLSCVNDEASETRPQNSVAIEGWELRQIADAGVKMLRDAELAMGEKAID